jgi:hypothetical protein
MSKFLTFNYLFLLFVQLGFSSNMVTSVTSAGLYFDSIVVKLWSGLMGSLVAQTFNGVTDKNSSSILIY